MVDKCSNGCVSQHISQPSGEPNMARNIFEIARKFCWAATFLGLSVLPLGAQQDPPTRVARLNYLGGNVSMQPGGANDWVPAEINRPFTLGDYLYTDIGARAELHLDNAVLRMGPQTSFGFLNLSDGAVQIKLSEGDMSFRLHNLGINQIFEVDTPNAAVTLLRNGLYRFRVDPNGNMSFVVTREGQLEVTGGGQAFTLNPGNSASVTGADQLSYDIEVAPAPDDFDVWCSQRDQHEAHLASARYLPPTMVGYEDLDDYGAWQEAPDYGPVWYPRQVAVGWAPYREGHWAWIEPWGWTWVDSAAWGFAPFHYGRWAFISGRWGWCPGPTVIVGHQGPVVRPYYAPALVAWFGGAHWGASLSVGGGPSLGWVPLGFGEVFTPHYNCSPRYFSNVNVNNTRIVKTVNITNVYNTVYVNKTVYNQQYVNVRAPGAVTAMPQSAFASGRPVRQGGFAVRQADADRIQPGASVIAPPVAPNRQAFLSGGGGNATRPAAAVFNRQVVARNAPPAAPASFAAQQQYVAQHAGQPHNFEAMHQAGAPAVSQAAFVRQAPPAGQSVMVHPGQRVGNAQAFRATVQPQPQAQPQQRQQQRLQTQEPPLTQPSRGPETQARAISAAPSPQAQPMNHEAHHVQGGAPGGQERPVNRAGEKPVPQPQAVPDRVNQQRVQEEHHAPQSHEESHSAPQQHGESHPAQQREDHHAPQQHEEHKDGEHKNTDHKDQPK